MLHPDARTVLLDALRPPPGAVFDHAVALTFTLDLQAALTVPLAFASGQGKADQTDPIKLMAAVREAADRIDVFCQAGQIQAPRTGSALYAFLEPMLHPVRQPRPGHLYHPKLWALRYWDPVDEHWLMRLLVMSRNLTFDRSWDICLRLDGIIEDRPRPANQPLRDLVTTSLELALTPLPDARRKNVDSVAEDLGCVAWENPEGVRELAFHALGTRGARTPTFAGRRGLAISPFLTEDGLALVQPASTGVVIARQEELDRLPSEVLDARHVYVVDELAGLPADEPATDAPADAQPAGGRPGSLLVGLHAKVYVIEDGASARLLLGSANATGAAFAGNVELLVELVGQRSVFGVDAMLDPESGLQSILVPYQRQPAVKDDEALWALEESLRQIAAVPFVATVLPDDETGSRMQLTTAAPLPGKDRVRLTIAPLTRTWEAREVSAGEPVDVNFGPLDTAEITPFFVVTASEAGASAATVAYARLVGDPANRIDVVLARQIDTPEKFWRFLMLLLGAGIELPPAAGDGEGGSDGTWRPGGGAIFELLVHALADRPAHLDALGRLVDQLAATEEGRSRLPEGFLDLWSVVAKARRGRVGRPG